MVDRQVVFGSLGFFLALIFVQSLGQSGNTSKILFVCEHGAARSPIASTYFNKMVGESGKKYVSFFRGTVPDSTLTKETASGLQKDGVDIQGLKPIQLTQSDIASASTIILLDCELQKGLKTDGKTIVRWNGIPAISKNYDSARNHIVKKIQSLVKSID